MADTGQKGPDRRLLLFCGGVFGLCILLFALRDFPEIDTSGPLRLNELGDFIAGIFASLAFVILVVSVRLQIIELRQNTEAVRNSAEELKRSVDEAIVQNKLYERSNQLKEIEILKGLEDATILRASLIGESLLRDGFRMDESSIKTLWDGFSSGNRMIFLLEVRRRIPHIRKFVGFDDNDAIYLTDGYFEITRNLGRICGCLEGFIENLRETGRVPLILDYEIFLCFRDRYREMFYDCREAKNCPSDLTGA